jgi:hypothetical protein
MTAKQSPGKRLRCYPPLRAGRDWRRATPAPSFWHYTKRDVISEYSAQAGGPRVMLEWSGARWQC